MVVLIGKRIIEFPRVNAARIGRFLTYRPQPVKASSWQYYPGANSLVSTAGQSTYICFRKRIPDIEVELPAGEFPLDKACSRPWNRHHCIRPRANSRTMGSSVGRDHDPGAGLGV